MSVTEAFYTQPAAALPQEAAKIAPVVQADELIFVKAIRTFALIVIVTEHVAFPLIYLYNSVSYSDWWISNNFYMGGKLGTLLFTMVSGLLLLNPSKEQPLAVFFRKRMNKVLIPFLAWSTLYLLWRIFVRQENFTPQEMLVLFIQGPVYYHLWFMQMILGLYLATPILRIYIRHTTRENLTYFLLVWLVAESILPLTERFFGFKVGLDVVVTTGYVGFFVLGYYLRDVTLTRRQLIPVLLTVVAALLFTQVVTDALTAAGGGNHDNFFLQHYSLNLIIAGTGIFLFLKSLDYAMIFQQLPFVQNVIMWISSCSLGIYLVHVVIIDELASGHFGFKLWAASFHPLLSIPAIAVLTLTLSVLVVMLLKQIPFVRQIVP